MKQSICNAIAELFATWFYVGKSPYAPGTAGSLAALPLAWIVQQHFGNDGLVVISIVLFFMGWWASSTYMRNSRTAHDPREIVIDEVAGQCLLLACLPQSLPAYSVGFLLFRAFDIVKPWPVSWLDAHIHGGLGVMLDDIAAALYPVALFILFTLIVYSTDLPIDPHTLLIILGQ